MGVEPVAVLLLHEVVGGARAALLGRVGRLVVARGLGRARRAPQLAGDATSANATSSGRAACACCRGRRDGRGAARAGLRD
jgi:hypothetical protein